MMTNDEMIVVLVADDAGKDIECRNGSGPWGSKGGDWNFTHCQYRVKPVEPKTIIEYDYGSGLQYISKDAFDSGTPEGIQHYMPYIELTPEVRATLTEKGILKG